MQGTPRSRTRSAVTARWRCLATSVEKSVSNPIAATGAFCNSRHGLVAASRLPRLFSGAERFDTHKHDQAGTAGRELSRLWVGREVSLHVLRSQRRRHAISKEITGARAR